MAVGVGVGVGVDEGCTFGATGASETPLFQSNFLPDLTQVNFLVLVKLMLPIFLQVLPALTAECAGMTNREAARVVVMVADRRLTMTRGYWRACNLKQGKAVQFRARLFLKTCIVHKMYFRQNSQQK